MVSCSVIIPTFNRARLLQDAVQSVLEQVVGDRDVEVIVVDDGSKDDTLMMLGSFGNQIKVITQSNRGPGAARNTGLSHCTGELICFCDSDDIWLPGKLDFELRRFADDPELGVIVTDSELRREGEVEAISRFAQRGIVFSNDELYASDLPPVWLKDSLFSTCCLSIRRRLFEKLRMPLFDESLRAYEDWDLELRLYRHARVLLCNRVTAIVRRYPDQTRPPAVDVLASKYRVIDRFIRRETLGPDLRQAALASRGDLARAIAKRASGIERLRSVPRAWRELKNGAIANGARVLRHAFSFH